MFSLDTEPRRLLIVSGGPGPMACRCRSPHVGRQRPRPASKEAQAKRTANDEPRSAGRKGERALPRTRSNGVCAERRVVGRPQCSRPQRRPFVARTKQNWVSGAVWYGYVRLRSQELTAWACRSMLQNPDPHGPRIEYCSTRRPPVPAPGAATQRPHPSLFGKGVGKSARRRS